MGGFIERTMEEDHKKYNQNYGSFYARGQCDCYYNRKRLPHKWVETTKGNYVIVEAITDDEIEEYLAGYMFMELFGERKWEGLNVRTTDKQLYGNWN